MKDKLDKTIDELKKKPKLPDVLEEVIVYKTCPLCGGPKTLDHVCPKHEWVGQSKIEQHFSESIQQVGVSDTYLPFVLTKLKICGINTEARQMIKDGKVKVNNIVVGLGYSTKHLSNFLLEVDGIKYEIFKID